MLPGLLLCMSVVLGCLLAGKILLHYFQLESYQFPGYFRTLRRNWTKALLPGACMSALLTMLFLLSFLFSSPEPAGDGLAAGDISVLIGMMLLLIAGGWLLGRKLSEKNAKKKFVLTPRVKRLYAVSFIVMTLILYGITRLINTLIDISDYFLILFFLFPLFLHKSTIANITPRGERMIDNEHINDTIPSFEIFRFTLVTETTSGSTTVSLS